MPGLWAESQICPNQPYSQHIVVRCRGCGSRHSTKNIGWRDKDNVVSLARHLFDIYGETCKCEDPLQYPLVHDCAVDDIRYDFKTRTFVPLKGGKEDVRLDR